jgi:hypothetical protein
VNDPALAKPATEARAIDELGSVYPLVVVLGGTVKVNEPELGSPATELTGIPDPAGRVAALVVFGDGGLFPSSPAQTKSQVS